MPQAGDVMAGAYMQRERSGHTLQATALVHEAYLRPVGSQPAQWQNQAHSFAIAAHSMREVLLDDARRYRAGKRAGNDARKVEINEELLISADRLQDVIAIDELLERLAKIDPRQRRVSELSFFAGLNVDETAEVMDVSPESIKPDWRSAKAWLHRELAVKSA